ncbi:MAG: hypothetical protein KBT27_15305 [Prevotellaceae bacterium]|nr:hypothetical protein [Candidatus Faecinaster equi]
MARGNKYVCRMCGEEYIYCPKCQVRPVEYMGTGFCSQKCRDVYDIVAAYRCKTKDTKELVSELKTLNINEVKFIPEIQADIDAINEEAIQAMNKAPKEMKKPIAYM